MGHSPGIGYPSSCIFPDDLQQTSVHSYSGGFIGLPTQLIVARQNDWLRLRVEGLWLSKTLAKDWHVVVKGILAKEL